MGQGNALTSTLLFECILCWIIKIVYFLPFKIRFSSVLHLGFFIKNIIIKCWMGSINFRYKYYWFDSACFRNKFCSHLPVCTISDYILDIEYFIFNIPHSITNLSQTANSIRPVESWNDADFKMMNSFKVKLYNYFIWYHKIIIKFIWYLYWMGISLQLGELPYAICDINAKIRINSNCLSIQTIKSSSFFFFQEIR